MKHAFLFLCGALMIFSMIFWTAAIQAQEEELPASSSIELFKKKCSGEKILFSLPLEAETQGRLWTVTNTVDLDPAEDKTKDFMGKTQRQARTYDQHNGTDFGLANFRKMDEGIGVFAAADGQVEQTFDGFFDRETQRGKPDSNMIILRHSNGLRTAYAHLRKNSLRVKKGDLVSRGQELAFVGSSGDSSGPHLHFEVLDCSGKAIDPIQQNLFNQQISFQLDPQVMDMAVSQIRDFSKEKPEQQIEGLKSNSFLAEPNQSNSIIIWISEMIKGNEIEMDVIDPDHKQVSEVKNIVGEMTKEHPMIAAATSKFKFPTEGQWTIITKVNGKKLNQMNFKIRSPKREVAGEESKPNTAAETPAADHEKTP